MFGIKDWINRHRHNRGFGVQSPAAFYLVTEVMREKLPYYAYRQIDSFARKTGEYTAAHCRLLFRLANYYKATSLISLAAGKGSSAFALSAARNTVPHYIISTTDSIDEEIKQILQKKNCTFKIGDEISQLDKILHETETFSLIHIGESANAAQAMKTALKHLNKHSMIIVEGIHRSEEKRKWWKEIKTTPQVVITFDLYNTGLIIFDTDYKKQHYTLKIK